MQILKDSFKRGPISAVASFLAFFTMWLMTPGLMRTALSLALVATAATGSDAGSGRLVVILRLVPGLGSSGLGLSFLNVCCHVRLSATSLEVRYCDIGGWSDPGGGDTDTSLPSPSQL